MSGVPRSRCGYVVLAIGTNGLPVNMRAIVCSAPKAFLQGRGDGAADAAEGVGPFLTAEQPDIFCFTFIMRTSRSPRLLLQWTRKSYMKAKASCRRSSSRSSKFLGLVFLRRPRFLPAGAGDADKGLAA